MKYRTSPSKYRLKSQMDFLAVDIAFDFLAAHVGKSSLLTIAVLFVATRWGLFGSTKVKDSELHRLKRYIVVDYYERRIPNHKELDVAYESGFSIRPVEATIY